MTGDRFESHTVRDIFIISVLLIGASSLLLLVPSAATIIIIWFTGFCSILLILSVRKNLLWSQKKWILAAFILYFVITVYVQKIPSDIESAFVNYYYNAQFSGGNISIGGVINLLNQYVLPGIVVSSLTIYGGLCYILFGMGMVRGKSRVVFVSGMIFATALLAYSRLESYYVLIASIGSPGTVITNVNSIQPITSNTILGLNISSGYFYLELLGYSILLVLYFMLALRIYSGKVPFNFEKEKNKEVVDPEVINAT